MADKIAQLWALYRDPGTDDELARDIIAKIEEYNAEAVESPHLVGLGSGINRVGQDVYGLGVGVGELLGIADEGAFGEYREGVHQERALMDPLKEYGPKIDFTLPPNRFTRGAYIGGDSEAQVPASSDVSAVSLMEGVGEIAATLPVGGVTGMTAKQIPNWGGRAAANVGIGATAGALGADDPGEGAMWGGGGAFLGEMAGNLAGLFRTKEPPGVPPSMADVPVMRADDTGSMYGSMEKGAEFTASGRNTVVQAREAQQEAFQEGVSKLQDKYAGPDVSQLPVSLENVKKTQKQTASNLYDEVGEQMEGVPVGDDWRGEIGETIKRLEADPAALRDNALIDRLHAYTDFNDPNYLAPGGRPSTWDELRRLRSLVSRDISDTFTGGRQVGTTDTPRLYEAKTAVTGALNDAAEGATGELWRDADTFYRTGVAAPYKDSPSIIKDIMNVQSPEQIVDKILSKNVATNPTLVGHVMDALDEPGKQALRTSMLTRAFGAEATGVISPAKAANFIHSKHEIFKKMFPGENIEELVKFLRHIKGAGQAGDIPQTGMGAAMAQGFMPPSIVGGGMMAGGMDLVATGGIVAGTLTLPVIMGKLLAAAATGEPGAIGKAVAEMGRGLSSTGRLAGAAVETED